MSWVCVTVNVFTGRLTLLKVGRRSVFRIVLKHLDRHSTIDFVLQ